MFVRTLSAFSRRFFTTIVVGSIAVPTIALASPDSVPTTPVATSIASQLAGNPAVTLGAHAIAPSIVERSPVAAAGEFDASVGALYAWVQVKNLGAETTISMVWKKDGKTRLTVELPVGHSSAWKTWSKKGISVKDAGAWTVEVLDADGTLVETLAFNVRGSADISQK